MWLERNVKANPVLFSTSFPKELLRYVSSSHYIARCIIYYYVALHYFLLQCLVSCCSKLFTLKCKKYIIFEIFALNLLVFLYYINIYKHIYEVCSLVTNVMSHKVQDFVNWFCTSTTGQIGFVEYTSFKYFPIIIKGIQMIGIYNMNIMSICCCKLKEVWGFNMYATYGLVDHPVWWDDKMIKSLQILWINIKEIPYIAVIL